MPHYTSNLTINMTAKIDLVGGRERKLVNDGYFVCGVMY